MESNSRYITLTNDQSAWHFSRNITTGDVFGGAAAADNCVEGFLFIFTSSESGTLVEI